MIQWLFFILFMIWTLALIWNGKDLFSKKKWFLAGLMFILVLVATVVIGFTLKWLAQSMSLFSVATAKHYSIIFSMSFLCVWGLKVTVVLLCTIFSGITGGHKKYNAENYEAISSMEGANKQVISSQADSLIKISRIWADFFPANTSNQPI
ncbi:hypothetical protein [Enterobacter roggenkampii]|uniref:hypothetical protein n=1 Tax=Enterobacter roggenkampii TaxID=1812935 RepID=UPI001E4687A6|nr:hypothetical protein [Enterobacter roggenkampii]UER60143.1 hypothetical protein LMJ44_13220 [Enterobacter roggenkampii]